MGKGEGKRPFGRPRVDGRIILRWICRKRSGGIDLIDLAQNKERWWVIVNAVIHCRVP